MRDFAFFFTNRAISEFQEQPDNISCRPDDDYGKQSDIQSEDSSTPLASENVYTNSPGEHNF